MEYVCLKDAFVLAADGVRARGGEGLAHALRLIPGASNRRLPRRGSAGPGRLRGGCCEVVRIGCCIFVLV